MQLYDWYSEKPVYCIYSYLPLPVKMKHFTNILTFVSICFGLKGQQIATFILHHSISKNDSVYDGFDNCVSNAGEWQVPLMVENDIRCFIHISGFQGSLQCVGGGCSGGAVRINECMKKYGIQEENLYLIRNNLVCFCEFVRTKYEDELTIYPANEEA